MNHYFLMTVAEDHRRELVNHMRRVQMHRSRTIAIRRDRRFSRFLRRFRPGSPETPVTSPAAPGMTVGP